VGSTATAGALVGGPSILLPSSLMVAVKRCLKDSPSASAAELNQTRPRRLTKGRHQLCPVPSPMTTVQGRMVHEVTKPFRT
jgi:hypothetical protein